MPKDQVGAFIPTTNIWDPTELYSTEVTSPEFKELLVRLYQNLNVMSIAINNKTTGFYSTSEFVSGNQYFPLPGRTSLSSKPTGFRQSYTKMINFGALPNAGTTNVAHGITVTASTIFVRIYGVANNQAGTSYLPLPFSSPTLVDNIELSSDDTNVTITTGSDRTAYTVSYIVLEFLK